MRLPARIGALLDRRLGARPAIAGENSKRALVRFDVVPEFQHLANRIPAEVKLPPSMMSAGERTALFNLAKTTYTGRGVILDAGIFLGASTCCFGEGLLRNRHASKAKQKWSAPIVSCELGVTNRTMLSFFERHDLPTGTAGDSLVPAIGRNIANVRELVDLRIGDITVEGAVDAPIEILFLDCLKQESISRFVVEQYFPRLLPGSIVVQQDFLSDMLPFIKVHQEFFADHFEFLGEVASSALFRCRTTVDPGRIEAWRAMLADPGAQIRLVEFALTRTRDPARRVLMSLSAMRLIGALEGIEAARQRLDALKTSDKLVLADPALPRRVRNAMLGAERLCASKGTRRDFIDAQLVSLGHDVPNR